MGCNPLSLDMSGRFREEAAVTLCKCSFDNIAGDGANRSPAIKFVKVLLLLSRHGETMHEGAEPCLRGRNPA